MSIDEHWFYVEVSGKVIIPITKTVTKNKEEELWKYIIKLYIYWETAKYPLSNVVEVPLERRKKTKNKLEETNK
jgi:hypothetical protein